MKKAKIALTALIVLAVLGGALALKAKQVRVFYCSTVSGGPCNVPTTILYSFTTLITNGADIITTALSTVPTTAPCPIITIQRSL